MQNITHNLSHSQLQGRSPRSPGSCPRRAGPTPGALHTSGAEPVRVEREALDELPDNGGRVQRPRVDELPARVDVRHRQLLDLGKRTQRARHARVHLVEIGALGQRPLGGLLVRCLGVQAGPAAHLVELDHDEAVGLPRLPQSLLQVIEADDGRDGGGGGGVGRVGLRAREARELREHLRVLHHPLRREARVAAILPLHLHLDLRLDLHRVLHHLAPHSDHLRLRHGGCLTLRSWRQRAALRLRTGPALHLRLRCCGLRGRLH
eukprot:scaffold113453_cov64-Phaeocystis_antarctica.AAC.7